MADYIYMLESRLSPEQQRGVSLVQATARAHEMNVYVTGGTIRDVISGFPIRDVDLTVEGNPLKLQKDLEKAGAVIEGADEDFRELFLYLPGNVRAGINMARTERYLKPGKPPEIAAAAIIEDLRRRDFSMNAIALSLNPGSRGLLLDPGNGLADIEAKLVRILHNYAFLEDPARLVRAAHFVARFHWTMEERTQARYNAAKENNYIEHISARGIGQEAEQLAYEDEPLHILRALEKEEWLKVLHPRWTVAKVDSSRLAQLLKTRQQMAELGYSANIAAGAMYFLTSGLSEREIAELQKHIPRKGFVKSWNNLEVEAKELGRRLTGKEAATPSRAWQLLSQTAPETIVFLEATSRQQAVTQKIRNFLGKWRQVKQRFPLPEMAELRITPELPVYPKLVEEMFLLMLDGKLRSSSEIIKFLKPHSPPPPPPPPPAPTRRGRAAKANGKTAAPPVAAAATAAAGTKQRKKKEAAAPAAHPAGQAVAAKVAAPEKKKIATGKSAATVPKKSKSKALPAAKPAKRTPVKKRK